MLSGERGWENLTLRYVGGEVIHLQASSGCYTDTLIVGIHEKVRADRGGYPLYYKTCDRIKLDRT